MLSILLLAMRFFCAIAYSKYRYLTLSSTQKWWKIYVRFFFHSQLQSICKAIDGAFQVARNLWSHWQFQSLADFSSCIACSFHSPMIIRLAARRCKLPLVRSIALHIM